MVSISILQIPRDLAQNKNNQIAIYISTEYRGSDLWENFAHLGGYEMRKYYSTTGKDLKRLFWEVFIITCGHCFSVYCTDLWIMSVMLGKWVFSL